MEDEKMRMSRNSLLTVIIILVSVAAGIYGIAQQKTPEQQLQEGDKAYTEKSYSNALKYYLSLASENKLPADRKDEIGLRICIALGKTGQWDKALKESIDFVKTHVKTVWEPRGLYWLGRLYVGISHSGWKIGNAVTRGNGVPKTDDASKPERVFLGQQDMQNSLDALEAARVYFALYRKQYHTESEEIDLNFDLARILAQYGDTRWAMKQKWASPSDPSWKIDPQAEYNPKWPLPKRILTLYAQIISLSSSTEKGAHSARALLAEALWLRTYHSFMAYTSLVYDHNRPKHIPYPYQNIKPDDILRLLIKEYPDDPLRDQAQYTLGLFYTQDQKYALAIAEFHRFLKEKPNSKWTQDAKAHLQSIQSPQLSIWTNGVVLPGSEPQMQCQVRNIPKLHFDVYKVKLEEVLTQPRILNDPNQNWINFGQLPNVQRYFGAKAASWDIQPHYPTECQYATVKTRIKIRENGAYAVVITGAKCTSSIIVIVSDLSLVQKIHSAGGLFFAANARTGHPEQNVHLLVRQWWWENNTQKTAFDTEQSDSNGLMSAAWKNAPGRTSFRLAALAWDGNRYAVTGQGWNWGEESTTNQFKVYTTTDRAVYRPMQTVHFREMVMQSLNGAPKTIAGKKIHIQVNDPNGENIYENTILSDAFGCVHGDISLTKSAPLGLYSISANAPDEPGISMEMSGNSFRVEEYKKPEFEVTVKPEADRVRVGEPVNALVHAEYYFGGPVPDAKVSYRIYRNYFYQNYRFPQPFDFLYGYSNNGDYNTSYRNGQVFQQGEAVTDSKGDAKITFPTVNVADSKQLYDYRYTIEADVMDSSRRTISGTGEVKATRHDVAVFLNFPHGYATKGDRVDVEIKTMNPSDMPVSVEGKAQVWLQPEKHGDKERLVHEEALKTDMEGRAYLRWTADKGGYYRIAYVTHDTTEEEVSGSIMLFVHGPELSSSHFLYQQVFLALENPYYQEGQTAKALLVTPANDCTVLLTEAANNEILSTQVILVSGRSTEINIPITKAEAPNVFLSAIMIRNGQAYQADTELFVPPVRQFNTITVTTDKAQYQPGEKAAFNITAKDWQGKPLSTELAVAISDASLSYIQKDFSPDIRVYYYGARRSNSIQTTNSFGSPFYSWQETPAQKTYETHEWKLPDGMGRMPDWPGIDQGMNLYTYQPYFGIGDRMQSMKGTSLGIDGSVSNDQLMEKSPAGGGFGGYSDVNASKALPASASPMTMSGLPHGVSSNPEAPSVRSNFADTAYWSPAVTTDADGHAKIEVTWPDNLTQWRAVAVGTTVNAQVGSGETQVRTKKNILIRMQAPRFFTERDTLVLSADVHNYLPEKAEVKCRLEMDGDNLAFVNSTEASSAAPGVVNPCTSPETTITLDSNSQKRVDWAVRVMHEGNVKIRMTAISSAASDAEELSFPVLVHGVERFLASSGVLREDKTSEINIDLPSERKPGSSSLVVQLNPSLATILMDSTPYLLNYPYGCIEQTMSRFLPAALVQKTLLQNGYNLEDIHKQAEMLAEKEKEGGSSQAIENSPYTYPKGRPGSVNIKELARYQQILHSPVFDTPTMNAMVKDGLERIKMLQNPDGGWGWWPDDTSDPYMTAYVLYGLEIAKSSDLLVDQSMLDKGMEYLKKRFLEEDNLHLMAFEARTLSMDKRYIDQIKELTTGRLYDRRERLTPYSKALLAIALWNIDDKDKANVLLNNMENTLKIDSQNGTASWGKSREYWWWWNDRVETCAAALDAYMQIRPDSKTAPMIVKWLVNNRRGNIWTSTKDTAMAIYAINEYAQVKKELSPNYTVTVNYDGRIERKFTVNKENALFADNQFIVPDSLLQTGAGKLTITKDGEGSCYWSAYTKYFSQEEPIRSEGNEIFVTRKYFRLVPNTAKGQPSGIQLDLDRPNPFLTHHYEMLSYGAMWFGSQNTQAGPRYERVAMKDGDTITSGEIIEVELQIESKNDYQYLVFEDMKPAGCESVELRSGSHFECNVCSNVEFRDQKTAFFLNLLPQGSRTLTYRLRAEIPGVYHVMPVNGYAMYAPDIRCLSDESHLIIKDR
jgi:uncharacterized protein YfaS (alpha-2-macroglobulin family)